ncbi:MAG: hypothetical protein QM765_03130 [Myxococcales bacterium]
MAALVCLGAAFGLASAGGFFALGVGLGSGSAAALFSASFLDAFACLAGLALAGFSGGASGALSPGSVWAGVCCAAPRRKGSLPRTGAFAMEFFSYVAAPARPRA